jgi:hypothetical protein
MDLLRRIKDRGTKKEVPQEEVFKDEEDKFKEEKNLYNKEKSVFDKEKSDQEERVNKDLNSNGIEVREKKSVIVSGKGYKTEKLNFLLSDDIIEEWETLALLSKTKVEANKKATFYSKRALLEEIIKRWGNQWDLNGVSETVLTKWMLKNGYSTKEQITNYYKSRSKERTNKIKRGVMIDELVSDLLNSEVQMSRLLENTFFKEGIKKIINEE